jgi:hypothetical protein
MFRYVCHLIEEVYKFGESRLEPNLNSNMNIQASHNEGVTQTLGEVRATLAEVTVIQSEERDGRLNKRFVFALVSFTLILTFLMLVAVRWCVRE